MAPYLDTVRSFVDVPITDAGVDTPAFLEASEGLLGMFELLNSTPLRPVQSDIKGNIQKVRERYNANQDLSRTLEKLVENEQREKNRTATQGLMWLLRGLLFTCKALQNTQADKALELSAAFSSSYEVTLRKHHPILMRGAFQFAMKGCPYRTVLYNKLVEDKSGGPPASEKELDEKLNAWLKRLEEIVVRMEKFYTVGKHDKGF